jgi:hypothetical protein
MSQTMKLVAQHYLLIIITLKKTMLRRNIRGAPKKVKANEEALL